jgi:hypothetical protein
MPSRQASPAEDVESILKPPTLSMKLSLPTPDTITAATIEDAGNGSARQACLVRAAPRIPPVLDGDRSDSTLGGLLSICIQWPVLHPVLDKSPHTEHQHNPSLTQSDDGSCIPTCIHPCSHNEATGALQGLAARLISGFPRWLPTGPLAERQDSPALCSGML